MLSTTFLSQKKFQLHFFNSLSHKKFVIMQPNSTISETNANVLKKAESRALDKQPTPERSMHSATSSRTLIFFTFTSRCRKQLQYLTLRDCFETSISDWRARSPECLTCYDRYAFWARYQGLKMTWDISNNLTTDMKPSSVKHIYRLHFEQGRLINDRRIWGNFVSNQNGPFQVSAFLPSFSCSCESHWGPIRRFLRTLMNWITYVQFWSTIYGWSPNMES